MKNPRREMIYKFIWLTVFLLIWETVRIAGNFSPLVYPSLFSVLHSLAGSVADEGIISQLLLSLGIIAAGLASGIVLASLLVMASHSSEIMESLLKTLISVFHPLPGIALLPVLLLWTGTGINSIMIIVIHSVLWPLVTNLYAGYKSIPETYSIVASNYGMHWIAVFFRITLPASFPYFLAGSRIAFARSWRALISAEMLFGAAGAKGGIGWYIYNKRVFMDSSGLFAGLLIIVIAGILAEDVLFNLIEKKTVRRWGMAS